MRYSHAALNPEGPVSLAPAPAKSAPPARRGSMPRRIFWRLLASALIAAVTVYVWRQR